MVNRNVSVNDVTVISLYLEFIQNPIQYFFIFKEFVIRVLILYLRFILRKETSLESCHFMFAIKRRTGTAPDIPENVSAFLTFFFVNRKKCFPDIFFQCIIQFSSLILFSIYFYFTKGTIFFQWHTAMIQQVAIIDFIKASLFQQEMHMSLQFFAAVESVYQPLNNLFLFCRQTVRIIGIYGWEIGIQHLIRFSLNLNGSIFIINCFQNSSIIHMKFRMSFYQFSFQLVCDDRNRFMHHSAQLCLHRIQIAASLDFKTGTGIIAISG